jgi:hypothetical protein
MERQTFLIHNDMPESFIQWKKELGFDDLSEAAVDRFDSGTLMLEAAAQGLGIAIMHDNHLRNSQDNRLAKLPGKMVKSPYSYWFVCMPSALEMRAKSFAPFHEFHGLTNNGFYNHAWVRWWLTFWQGVNIFHTFGDLAPYCVLAVQKFGIAKADEKLAVGAVRVHGAGHRTGSAYMRLAVKFLRQIRLIRTTCASAQRTTALRHKAINDAVKFHAVVKSFFYQFCNPRNMLRRKIRTQCDDNVTSGEGKSQFVAHQSSLFSKTAISVLG